MPQFTAPLTVMDGSATPVAITYSPELLSAAKAVFVDRREASRNMQPSLEVAFDPANTNRKTFKVKRVVKYPIKATINGVEVVTDVAYGNVEYTLPQTMSSQQRKHLRALVANAEDVAIFKAAVEDLEPLY